MGAESVLGPRKTGPEAEQAGVGTEVRSLTQPVARQGKSHPAFWLGTEDQTQVLKPIQQALHS